MVYFAVPYKTRVALHSTVSKDKLMSLLGQSFVSGACTLDFIRRCEHFWRSWSTCHLLTRVKTRRHDTSRFRFLPYHVSLLTCLWMSNATYKALEVRIHNNLFGFYTVSAAATVSAVRAGYLFALLHQVCAFGQSTILSKSIGPYIIKNVSRLTV